MAKPPSPGKSAAAPGQMKPAGSSAKAYAPGQMRLGGTAKPPATGKGNGTTVASNFVPRPMPITRGSATGVATPTAGPTGATRPSTTQLRTGGMPRLGGGGGVSSNLGTGGRTGVARTTNTGGLRGAPKPSAMTPGPVRGKIGTVSRTTGGLRGGPRRPASAKPKAKTHGKSASAPGQLKKKAGVKSAKTFTRGYQGHGPRPV